MDLIATEENTVQCRVEFEYIISNIKEELERFRDTPRQNGVFNPFTLLCKDLVIGNSNWQLKVNFDVSINTSKAAMVEDFYSFIKWNPGPVSVTGPIPKMIIAMKSLNMFPCTLIPYVEFRPECVKDAIVGMGVNAARKDVKCEHKTGEHQWQFQPGEEKIVEGVDLRKVASLGPTIRVFFSLVESEGQGAGQTAGEVSRDMLEMFERAEYTDFTIVVNGDNIPVHKSILAARSVFFRQMLAAEMLETQTNTYRLQLAEVGTESVRTVLRYIYSGLLDTGANLDEVLLLADYLALDRLKDTAEDRLGWQLLRDSATAVRCLVLADRCAASRLRRVAKRLLLENSELYLKDENVKLQLNKDLLFELLQGILSKQACQKDSKTSCS